MKICAEMKICIKCKLEKELFLFNKWYKKTGRTGYRTICKICEHKENKLYREQNKIRLAEKRKYRTGSGERKICTDPIKKRSYERIYRYQKKFPEKARARTILNYHVNTGKLKNPNKCEICMNKIKTEAHHNCYYKPLEIQWVCKSCHTNIHYGT